MEKQFEIRPSRKSNIKAIRKKYVDDLAKYQQNNKLSIQKVSAEELGEIKSRIRLQLKQETRKRQIFTYASVMFVSMLLGYFIFSLILG